MTLTVGRDKKVIVKCPVWAEDKRIEKFLNKSARWVEKRFKFFSEVKTPRVKYNRDIISGGYFLYLGRNYKISVERGLEDEAKLRGGVLRVYTTGRVNDKKSNEKIVEGWLCGRRERVFGERLKKMMEKFNYEKMPRVEARKMKRRWGSCVGKEKIILNKGLVKSSGDCIDFVITHELCHIKYPNHSARFYNFLEVKYPNWQKKKEKLETRYSFEL